LDSHPESQSLGLDTLPSSQGSSLSSVSLETLANDVQIEEETHLQSFTDMLQASMQNFLMAIQAKSGINTINCTPPSEQHANPNNQFTNVPRNFVLRISRHMFFLPEAAKDILGSEGGIRGHLKNQTAAQGPSEGGNNGARAGSQGQGHATAKSGHPKAATMVACVGLHGQGHGHCEKWPSKDGNDGAHAGLQGHPELELGLEDEQEEGADGCDLRQGTREASSPRTRLCGPQTCN